MRGSLRIWFNVYLNPWQVCLSALLCFPSYRPREKELHPSHLALTKGAGAQETTRHPTPKTSTSRAVGCLAKSAPVWLFGALSGVFWCCCQYFKEKRFYLKDRSTTLELLENLAAAAPYTLPWPQPSGLCFQAHAVRHFPRICASSLVSEH